MKFHYLTGKLNIDPSILFALWLLVLTAAPALAKPGDRQIRQQNDV